MSSIKKKATPVVSASGKVIYTAGWYGIIQADIDGQKSKVYFNRGAASLSKDDYIDEYYSLGATVIFDAQIGPPDAAYKWRAHKVKHKAKPIESVSSAKGNNSELNTSKSCHYNNRKEESKIADKKETDHKIKIPPLEENEKKNGKADIGEQTNKHLDKVEGNEKPLIETEANDQIVFSDCIKTSGECCCWSESVENIKSTLKKLQQQHFSTSESITDLIDKYNKTSDKVYHMTQRTHVLQTEIKNVFTQHANVFTNMLKESDTAFQQKLNKTESICMDRLDKLSNQFVEETKHVNASQQLWQSSMTDVIAKQESINKVCDQLKQENDEMKTMQQHLQNTVTETQMKLVKSEKRCEKLNVDLQHNLKENIVMKTHIEKLECNLTEIKSQLPPPISGDLFLGDKSLVGVEHYLLADCFLVSLENTNIDDYDVNLRKDEHHYGHIYIVIQLSLQLEHVKKLVDYAKNRARTGVTVSSILPRPNMSDYNEKANSLNKHVESLCRELGVNFTNNDMNFKNLDGSVKDEYYCQDGTILTDPGIRRLLKNMGLSIHSSTQI